MICVVRALGAWGEGGCLNCDLGDLGRWGVICVVRALGAWGWGGCLNCDLGDLGRWGVICVVQALGVGMGGLSEL